jgi:1-acyl-sn-glycerol-3-phosphate acyltransferase
VRLRGRPLAAALLRWAGWRVRFDGLPGAQGVIVVYPHTSNWDFVVGVLAKWAIGIPVTFWGKDSLFRVPVLGCGLRRLGGVPVDRSARRGAVGEMAARLRAAREHGTFLWLVLSPEGTRRRTAGWRSGFHQVALQAEVPVGLVTLDYGTRCVSVDSFWRLSGDPARDHEVLAARAAGCRGLRPESASPVRPLGP